MIGKIREHKFFIYGIIGIITILTIVSSIVYIFGGNLVDILASSFFMYAIIKAKLRKYDEKMEKSRHK